MDYEPKTWLSAHLNGQRYILQIAAAGCENRLALIVALADVFHVGRLRRARWLIASISGPLALPWEILSIATHLDMAGL